MSEDNDRIYELLDKLDSKMDEQTERLVRLEVHTEHNSESLDHHIKRTDLLEEKVTKLKDGVCKKFQEIEAPKNTAKTLAKWITGIAGFVGVVAGAVYAVMRIWKI